MILENVKRFAVLFLVASAVYAIWPIKSCTHFLQTEGLGAGSSSVMCEASTRVLAKSEYYLYVEGKKFLVSSELYGYAIKRLNKKVRGF